MPRAAVVLSASTAGQLLALSQSTVETRITNQSTGVLYIRFAREGDSSGGDVTAADGTYDVRIPEETAYIMPAGTPAVAVWGYKAAGGSVNVSTNW